MSKLTTTKILGASLLAVAGSMMVSAPAMAGCSYPYVPVKHSSGNTVCVHQAVVNGPKNLAAPQPYDPTAQIAKKKRLKLKLKNARR